MKYTASTLFVLALLCSTCFGHWYIVPLNSQGSREKNADTQTAAGNTNACNTDGAGAQGANGYLAVKAGQTITTTLNIFVAHSGGPITGQFNGVTTTGTPVGAGDDGQNRNITTVIPSSFSGKGTVQFLFAASTPPGTTNYYQCLDIQASSATTVAFSAFVVVASLVALLF